MPAYVPGEDEEDVEHSDSIWRRLMGTTKSGNFDNRTQAQRMRDKGVKRLKYRAKYTLKSRLRAFGVVGLGAGSLLMMFGPYRARIKEFVVPPDPIPVAQVMLGETPPLEQGRFGERFASDNKSDTALVFVWDDENPQPISFTVDLTGSKNVKKLVFETGFPNDNEFGPLIKRPERLTLSAGGEIQEVVLADFEGPQRVAFDLPKDTRQIEVTIETVHDRNWDTYDRVAIAEIAVVR